MLVLQFLLLKQRVSIVCKVQCRGNVTVQEGELLKQYFCVTLGLTVKVKQYPKVQPF